MSGLKRRLSSNKGLLGLHVEDDDDEDESNDMNSSGFGGVSRRRSLGGRRRSSFGSHHSKSPGSSVEQSRIAEMYKNVIKMSTENKINNKNSWTFDLIDHMGNLIKGETTGSRGVNFQKASCTLDASVKIYSHRVDDTHASSRNVLENLSRTYGGDTGGDDNERGVARVGTKSASNKLNIANTLATDVESINAVKLERVQATDPMFHKMSKAFDDGGAKGMLMANLRVSSSECSLFFSSAKLSINETDAVVAVSQAADIASAPIAAFTGRVDISDLINKCGFDAASLLSMQVCPALQSYREVIGVTESESGVFDPDRFPSYFHLKPTYDTSSTANYSRQESNTESYSNSDAFAFEDDGDDNEYDGGDDGDFGQEEFDDFPIEQHQSTSSVPSSRKSMGVNENRRSSSGGVHKIQWAAVEEERTDVESGQGQGPTTPQSQGRGDSLSGEAGANAQGVVWDATGITSTNDYSFFDMEVVNRSNSWAGARHWKYATRRQGAQSATVESKDGAVDGEEGRDVEPGPVNAAPLKVKSIKTVKENVDFAALFRVTKDWPSEESFVVSKSNSKSKSGDVTRLTAAALEKEALFEEEGGLFLPPDAKLQTSDLCRLMLCNNIIVPPPMLAHVFIKQVASSSSLSKGKSTDVIWGQVRKVTGPSSGGFQPVIGNVQDDYDDDNDGGGDFGEDFCDPDGDDQESEADSLVSRMQQGLHISTEGLLKASRTVDKIDIGFATVAKRVNVKRLKSDIWTHIDDFKPVLRNSLGDISMASSEGGTSSISDNRESLATMRSLSVSKDNEMSFQDLVCDITSEQKQKDVSLPFYFLCLLHLANEKTLHIDGSPDMNDLFISKSD